MPRKPVLSQSERTARVGTGGQLRAAGSVYSKPLWQRGNDLSFITFFLEKGSKKIQKMQKHTDVTERGDPGHNQQWGVKDLLPHSHSSALKGRPRQ